MPTTCPAHDIAGSDSVIVDPFPVNGTATLMSETLTVAESSITIVAETSVPTQVHQLMEQIDRVPAQSISSQAQAEMAKIVKLLPDLVAQNDPYLTACAKLAVTSLLEGEPSLRFAKSISRHIESKVGRWKQPFRVMYRGRPPLRATLGLLIFFIGATVVLSVQTWAAMRGWTPQVQGIDGGLVAASAAMGGIGSIISIFVRLPQMSTDFRTADPEVPLFVGLLKPMVGMAFAVFAFVAVEGGFLPITVDATRRGAFYMAIAFIAGFSERFVPDIISKAERQGNARGGA